MNADPLTFPGRKIKIEQGEVLRMPKTLLRAALCLLFGFRVTVFSVPQDNPPGEGEMSRGSIPEALFRPQRGEAPRYPVDTVIGALGRGAAYDEAYLFARKVSAALTAGNQNDPSLSGMNRVSLEAFISELSGISPHAYRLGSGREEPDGAVSLLVRFIGRDRAITGELYIRPQGFEPEGDPPAPEPAAASETAEAGAGAVEAAAPAGDAGLPEAEPAGDAEAAGPDRGDLPAPAPSGPLVWQFEDLILEEARERETEEDNQRFDFPPYERFF
jgi:hypothetical protein